MNEEQFLKETESALKAVAEALRQELSSIRGSRATVDMVENIPVSCYEQTFAIKQLAAISVPTPREINLQVWDKNVVGPIMKAIDGAKIGLTTSNDGPMIHANLSPLMAERREELAKQVKKKTEEIRITIRNRRDDWMKRIKSAQDSKELSEDRAFKLKDKLQKQMDQVNAQAEQLMAAKLAELQV